MARAERPLKPCCMISEILEEAGLDREMVGLPLLDEFARSVFGEQDPTRVFYSERPFEIRKEGRGHALYLRLPFAEKDRIQVSSLGEELVVQVDNHRRHVLLPRSLAGRRVTSAAYADARLRVSFGGKERDGES